MVLGEAVRAEGDAPSASRRLAIGVGFRKACSAETLAGLVRNARYALAEDHPWTLAASAVLATIAEKDRPALRAAAADLCLAVLILPKRALAGTEDRITVESAGAKACFGIPSVAEAAALAAAGAGSTLLLRRVSVPEATCAIAVSAAGAPA